MFYKKKLDNIQALQAEKRALKRKYAAFNAEEIVAKKEKKRSKKNQLPSNVLQSVLGNTNVISIAAQIIPILLPSIANSAVKFGVKKLLVQGTKEIAGGYVKWKAVEIIGKFIYKKINLQLKKEA